MARPLHAVRGRADDRARHHDRERRAAFDPGQPRLHRERAGVGRQRLHAHLRRLPAARRAPRRPLRQRAVHDRGGGVMIGAEPTNVNVALPSIQGSLGFTESALVWVVNAYMLTYGGFLLLGGRLGDLYGKRRLFLAGITLFTAASLVCGLAASQAVLVAARAIQGLGGAVVSAIALSLIMNIFTEAGDRAKAMGIYGFVCAGGGSIGVLAGGLLTSALSWHWVFLVNLPIGVAVYAFCTRLLSKDAASAPGKLDLAGAVTITTALMLAVYGIVDGNQAGWTSARTLSLLGGAIALLAVFIVTEMNVSAPLMPLGLFRVKTVAAANILGVFWAAAMFAWFFLSALYMQTVLGYDPMKIGLAFLPSNRSEEHTSELQSR